MTGQEARDHATRTVQNALRTAHPGVEGERETHLMIAVGLSYHARYAAAVDRFGPRHEMTLAFLKNAISLAQPIGEETRRLVNAALDLPVEA
jgi:hypothetical protein